MAGAQRRRAGTYAQQRYKRGLREWRARIRPISAAVFGPIFVAGTAIYFINGESVSWLAGMASGAAFVAWLSLRETPPQYIENWQIGAEGERKTERALAPLIREGWHIFHDVPNGNGNYDHIAIGPPGVFLLETKNLQGTVEVDRGTIRLRRRLDPDAKPLVFDRVRPQVLASAARLNEQIETRTGHRTWVQAAVVLWSPFSAQRIEDKCCVFIHGDQLLNWLRSRPTRLQQGAIEAISSGVSNLTSTSDTSSVNSPDLSANDKPISLQSR